MLAWMAWTWETAAFFGAIALALCAMTAIALRFPEMPRRGALGLVTTRGDRLFLSLLSAAWIHVLWLGLAGDPLWPASLIALAWAAALFRWA